MGIFANSSSSVLSTPSFGDSAIHCRPADGHESSEWEPFIRQSYSLWMWVMLEQGPQQTISFLDGCRLPQPTESLSLNTEQARCYFRFGDNGSATRTQGLARSAHDIRGSNSSDSDLISNLEYIPYNLDLKVLAIVEFRPSGKLLTYAPLYFKSSTRIPNMEVTCKQEPKTCSGYQQSDNSLIYNPKLQTLSLSGEMNIKENAEVEQSRRDKPVKSSLSGRNLSKESKTESSRYTKKSVKFSERCSVLEYETELQASYSPRSEFPQDLSQKSGNLETKQQNQMIKAQGLIEFDSSGLSSFSGGHNKENMHVPNNLTGGNKTPQMIGNFSRKPAINLKELELNPKMYATKKTAVTLAKQVHNEQASSLSSAVSTPIGTQPQQLAEHRCGVSAGEVGNFTEQNKTSGYSKVLLANSKTITGVQIGPKALSISGVYSMGLIRPLVRAPTPLREERPTNRQFTTGGTQIEQNESAVTGSEDDSVILSKRKRAEFEGIHSGSLLKKRSTSDQQLRSSRKTAGLSDDKDNILNELRSQRMQRASNFDPPRGEKSLLLRSVQSDTSLLSLTKGLIAKAERVTTELRSDFNKKLLDNTPLNMEDFRRSIDKTLSKNQQLLAKPSPNSEQILGIRSARPWFGMSSISTSNLLAPEHLKHRSTLEPRAVDPQTRTPTEPNPTQKPSYLYTLSSHALTNSTDLKRDALLVPTPRSERGHPGTPNYIKSRANARNLPHRSSLQLLGTPLLL